MESPVRGSGATPRPAPPRTATERPLENVVPNVYDWIYVVGIGEDGSMTFETVNPPLHAGGGFLNPDFAGRAPETASPEPSAGLLVAHFGRVLAEGRPLQFEEEHRSRPDAGTSRRS